MSKVTSYNWPSYTLVFNIVMHPHLIKSFQNCDMFSGAAFFPLLQRQSLWFVLLLSLYDPHPQHRVTQPILSAGKHRPQMPSCGRYFICCIWFLSRFDRPLYWQLQKCLWACHMMKTPNWLSELPTLLWLTGEKGRKDNFCPPADNLLCNRSVTFDLKNTSPQSSQDLGLNSVLLIQTYKYTIEFCFPGQRGNP